MFKLEWCLLVLVLLERNKLCWGLKIKSLNVPRIVQANSSEVILDCNYMVQEWERNNGFVLKWYINGINLVYQWIPPRPPQDLGSLRGRLDLSYRASDDVMEEHRALKILNPDPALSGIYSCKIATFEEEDNDQASLLIWSPPSEVRLKYWRPSPYLVNISCSAFDVSPKPVFKLYLVDPDGKRIDPPIHGRSDRPGSFPGLYESHTWGILIYSNTRNGSKIGCIVYTSEKLFYETREDIYISDSPVITTTTTTTTTQRPEEEAIRSPNIASVANSFGVSKEFDSNLVLFLSMPSLYRSLSQLYWMEILLLYLICKFY